MASERVESHRSPKAMSVIPAAPCVLTHFTLYRGLWLSVFRGPDPFGLHSQMPDVPAAYRMLGDFYFARNDSEKALAEFSSLVASHANELGVKKTYVQLLILAHKLRPSRPAERCHPQVCAERC
jgi:hypothetical protein